MAMLIPTTKENIIYHYMAWCTKLTKSDADMFLKTMAMIARFILDLAYMISIPLIWL